MKWTAVDVGTSSVKLATFDEAGRVLASHVRPVPAPVVVGNAVTQDFAAIVAACDALLAAGDHDAIVLTTQRDTVVLDGELISWMDARDLWEGDCSGVRAAHSLHSALLAHWTGEAVETPATHSARLMGTSRERFLAQGGSEAALPVERALGEPAGQWQGRPVFGSAGDKNCELLGNGVVEPGQGGLSLGSGVSLGVLATARPTAVRGAIVTPAALANRFNVETGLIAGMSARAALGAWLPVDEVPGEWVPDLWMLPHFAGALDRPARGALVGLGIDTVPRQIAQAWAQGVVAELARLRPALERCAGTSLSQITVSGGGAGTGWAQLVADAFGIPVATSADRFAGCRGAVAAVRIARGESLPFVPADGITLSPTAPGVARFEAWATRFNALFESIR